MQMRYSVHLPNEFICAHLDQLLPQWSVPVSSVLVVLQPCQLALLERTPETETQKNQLREKFIGFGYSVALKLKSTGHWADLFDPRTGFPMLSEAGYLKLDDTAVVQSCLGYQLTAQSGCFVIEHPTWGTAVYPSILVSSASPTVVELVAREIAASLD